MPYSVGRLVGQDIEPLRTRTIPLTGGLMKGETHVTRFGTLVARAIVLALLLLTLSGGVVSAGGGVFGTQSLPEDPGYGLTP